MNMDNSAGNQAEDADHGATDTHVRTTRGAEGATNRPGNSVNKIVSKLSEQIDEFSKASKNVRVLTESVRRLNALKRKQNSEGEQANKRHCSDREQPGTSAGTAAQEEADAASEQEEESSDSELEDFMAGNLPQEEQPDDYADLDEYFQPDEGTGEDVGEKMAQITQNALRGKKAKRDEEKLQELVKKHLRRKNVPNLQVPKVDEYLWSQLRRGVKRVDYIQQKSIANYGQAITPLIRAMELMQANKEPERAKGYVVDAFKLLCLNIKATNLERLDNVKKELNPKYKSLVPEQPSTTKLLGDNFQDAVKKVDGAKSSLTTSGQNFLGKRRGDRPQSQTYKRYPYNNRNYKTNQRGFQYNQNNKAKNQNFNKKTHQPRK